MNEKTEHRENLYTLNSSQHSERIFKALNIFGIEPADRLFQPPVIEIAVVICMFIGHKFGGQEVRFDTLSC
jgi:hypothetical protein